MAMLAAWFQVTYSFSSGNAVLLMVFIGLVAVAMVVQAIAVTKIASQAEQSVKEATATVNELKAKLLPLIQTALEVTHSGQTILREAAPKIKVITDNLVETSNKVKATALQVDKTVLDVNKTVLDANQRTQRQVARVDSMVTATLTATAEAAESIQQGIRVPVQKIAALATQTRFALEGMLAKARSTNAKPPTVKR